MQIPDKQTFRIDEVSELLSVPVRTLYYWISIGQIEAYRPGKRSLRVPRSELVRISLKTTLQETE